MAKKNFRSFVIFKTNKVRLTKCILTHFHNLQQVFSTGIPATYKIIQEEIKEVSMYVAPINYSQINNTHGLKRNNKVYNQNTSVSFGSTKQNFETAVTLLGIFSGIVVFLMPSLFKGNNKTLELDGQTKEYYDSVRTVHHVEIYQNGDNEYLPTQNQLEQIDRMNNRVDSVLKDFPSGTIERDNMERIYNGELDKISDTSSESGIKITPNEEAQIILDLVDSAKTLYPDKKVDIII